MENVPPARRHYQGRSAASHPLVLELPTSVASPVSMTNHDAQASLLQQPLKIGSNIRTKAAGRFPCLPVTRL